MKKHLKKLIIFLIIAVMVIPAVLLTACTTEPKATIEGIAIEGKPSKTEYFLNEDLDITGFKIKVIYSNGTFDILDVQKGWVNGFDASSVGTKTLTIKYMADGEEFTTTTAINVKNENPSS